MADVPRLRRSRLRLPIPPRTSSLKSKEGGAPTKPQPSTPGPSTSRPTAPKSPTSRPPYYKPSTDSSPRAAPNDEEPRDPATLSQVERQILLLQIISDRRHGDTSRDTSPYNEPIDARSLIRLVATHSLAARDLSSLRIARFVEKYHEVSEWDTTGEGQGALGAAALVGLEVIDEANRERLGTFSYNSGALKIWLKRPPHVVHRRDFNDLLRTLVHEMCHGYLRFADSRHPEHRRLVSNHSQHGRGFWALFRYIARAILNFTGSEKWREQTVVIEKDTKRTLGELPE
ncbi:hypothetical protein EKO27_g9582 [Xylaria grammica]|uniref:SprT-like domain-containing protein n=1 Tax=Xylaria grammica TaxID=363999 RepID=A0A439CTQ3_9PEZI|nr:hypothetical protein EKO27_g9582 [Xylaria grammica]